MIAAHRLSSSQMNNDQHIYMAPQMTQSAHDNGTIRRTDCVPAYAVVPHSALVNDRSECELRSFCR